MLQLSKVFYLQLNAEGTPGRLFDQYTSFKLISLSGKFNTRILFEQFNELKLRSYYEKSLAL